MPPKPMIRPFEQGDAGQIVDLWESCGLTRPWNDPLADIARKQAHGPDLFLVAAAGTRIIGTVMAGFEGHRGWINYLAVAPDHRQQGLGRRMVVAAEEKLSSIGCPKINLQIRSSNAGVVEFYRRLGYSVDEVISMGKRL